MKTLQTNKTTELEINLDEVVEKLLAYLKARSKEILIRRFGLGSINPQVLDKIGRDFNITRERVRQIERDGLRKLHKAPKSAHFQAVIEKAIMVLKQNGGFCERKMLKELILPGINQRQRNQLMFILNSSNQLRYNKGSLSVNGFWYLKEEIKSEQILRVHQDLVAYFRQQKVPMNFEKVFDYLRQSVWAETFEGAFAQQKLRMLFVVSRVIEQNILGELGIRNWKTISQRGTREKAFLVLKKYQKPLHFSEITALLNKHWEGKTSLPQTVHNELIKDSRFVLVGRGMYGLSDWGYDEGTVKEIIVKLLGQYDQPVEKHIIIDHVLKKKKVKRTTVMVNLADRQIFQRNDEGKFFLNNVS